MAFESGVVPENWKSAVTVSLYKGKGEKTECKNYISIRLLSVVKKKKKGRACRLNLHSKEDR